MLMNFGFRGPHTVRTLIIRMGFGVNYTTIIIRNPPEPLF